MRSTPFLLLALFPIGDAFRVEVDDEDALNVDAESEWGFRCPYGLEANRTTETCTFHGELFHDPDRENGMTDAWAGGSNEPLVFTEWGGLDDPNGMLVREMQYMYSSQEFVREHVHLQMTEEMEAHGNSRILREIGSIAEEVEADAENLEAIEFVAHHVIEDLVIENLAHGLTALGGVLLHGAAHAGFSAATGEALIVGAEVLEFGLSILGNPIVIGLQVAHAGYQLGQHYIAKDAASRGFAFALVGKADCISSKVLFHREEILDDQGQLLDRNFFVPEFAAVCGKAAEPRLAEQMVKTNAAMLDLFNEFKGIGKCMFPEGPRSWSKSNCVHAIDGPLREHEGRSGILYTAFALAAAYGQETDDILSNPVYSEWFQRYFNISLPPSEDVQQELIRIRDNDATTVSEKASACISVVGLHRAFERMFVRLRNALKIFMHTFARQRIHFSTRTIQHPCRRVFREIDDRDQGLCKDGTDLPLRVPDTEWLQSHAQRVTGTQLDDVGSCIEDTHPELALSLSLHHGEHGEEEEGEQEEEGDEE